jgi:hypothetical protein
MYTFTDHAKRMMKARKITQDDVKNAIESGELAFTKTDEKGRGTERYHSIELADPFPRTIVVGWVQKDGKITVITAYEVRRKRK